uniref:Uncharacterized protein n=1 Tax=Panagrolaimus sp. PS1159 TaxID=55785 RepID=A0AC35FE03_9BILA
MDLKYYLNLNDQFRDVRLSWVNKLEEMKCFISMIEEYQTMNPSSNLSELNLSIPLHDIKEMVRIHLDNPKKKHVFVRGNNGKYISGENGEHYMKCDRDVPLGWEKFIIEDVGNGKISLKSMNKYVSSENGDDAMTCNRKNADSWEFFEMIENDDGTFAFKGNNGKFVSSENGKKPIGCYVSAINEWEKFHIEHIKSPSEEVQMQWKMYIEHFTKLWNKYDSAINAKKNMNPENYYYSKAITIKHEGNEYIKSYSTHHQERRFDNHRFKADMKKADDRCSHTKWKLNEKYDHLFWCLNNENSREKMIAEMYSCIFPAKTFIEERLKKEEMNEDEKEEADTDGDSDVSVIPAVEDEDDRSFVF